MITTRALLEQLAAFRPVSADVTRVNATVDALQQYLVSAQVHTVVEMQGDRKILYAATCPGKTTGVMLNAHLDVVPGDEAVFHLREAGGQLYGRGTHDCLGNSAVVANTLVRLNGRASVGAIFSTDEEIGGSTTRTMVQRGYTGSRLSLVLDGRGYAVTVAQKGIVNMILKASGRACHAAEPWKGDNAIDRLIAGYLKVKDLIPPVTPPDEWHNTMAATIIRAGTVANRVPDEAEMTLNIRFTGQQDADLLLDRIRMLSGLQVEARLDCLPVSFDPDTPVLRELVAFMGKTLGTTIAVDRMNGATDARHFAVTGVPVAIIGVPGKDAHGRDESIDLAAMQVYEDMLVNFLGGR